MADLSNLLGDVYGDPDAGGDVAPERAPEPPAWADESRLDEAFADWTPEPLEPAVAKLPTSSPGSSAASAPLDDDLAAALSAALADAPRPTAAPAVERFAHVDAPEPLDPPVVDAATLEPIEAPPVVDVDAVEAAFVPPTPVEEDVPAPTPVGRGRGGRSLSFSLPRRARAPKPEPVPEPVFVEPAPVDAPVVAVTAPPVAAASGRAWQRTDDDILPAGARGGSSRRRAFGH